MGKAGGSGETTDLLQVTYKLNYPLIGIRTHNPHHVYMSIPDRIHTCDFIGRLFLGILRIYKILQILWSIALKLQIGKDDDKKESKYQKHIY